MRRLASIRKVKTVAPISGADNIEVITVDGWSVVSGKGDFSEGDLCVYFEIDSLLPEREEFEFLRKGSFVNEHRSVNGPGFRLRTIRLRNQLSQGLAMPVSAFSELTDIQEGMDVSDLLGVKIYEKVLPACLQGLALGQFPGFIRKTDQERIQNCFDDLAKNSFEHLWEVTLKLDGTSGTFFFDARNKHYGVCSRNLELKHSDDNTFWVVSKRYDLEKKLAGLGRSLAIQGEIMGPGIQKNNETLNNWKLFVFDILDIESGKYLSHSERIRLCKELELDHVPIFEINVNFKFDSVDDFLDLAERGYGGRSLNSPNREGLVFKSLNDPDVSFKAISNNYLLNEHDG